MYFGAGFSTRTLLLALCREVASDIKKAITRKVRGMTYVEISYEEFSEKVQAEIRRMTLRGEGCRTSECSDNSLLVSRILGGDGYCGKDPRMVKDGSGWMKKIIRSLVESEELIPMAGGGYCWLVPADLTHKNGIGAEPCGLFDLY